MSLMFCVKQKTAYEWRISGWSSDVCSSDLPGTGWRSWILMVTARLLSPARRPRRGAARGPACLGSPDGRGGCSSCRCGRGRAHAACPAAWDARTDVVEGRSGYVGVGVGGSQAYKQKTQKERYEEYES